MTPHPPLWRATFRLARHTIIETTQHFATSRTFGRGCIFFLLTFTLLHLLSSDFTSSHLLFICFSTLQMLGSLLFKLPSITQYSIVLFPTRKCYSSTSLYYKVLLQYYSVLLQYYKVLLQYFSVLHSTTPYYKAKCYSSTSLYYKVLLQYYSVLLQYYKVLLQYYKVLLQYYSVLQSTTPVLVCTTKYYSVLCTTKYYSSTALYYSSTSLY